MDLSEDIDKYTLLDNHEGMEGIIPISYNDQPRVDNLIAESNAKVARSKAQAALTAKRIALLQKSLQMPASIERQNTMAQVVPSKFEETSSEGNEITQSANVKIRLSIAQAGIISFHADRMNKNRKYY